MLSLRQGWPYGLPLLAVLIWLPALSAAFQFDDYNVIVDFAPIHSLSSWWQSLPAIRPLLKLSYALNWWLSPTPLSFHVVNLLIHAANGLLLYSWLKHLPVFSPRLAMWVALLWFVHPATTEAVTYIAGRSVSLSTTLALASLYFLQQSQPRRYLAAALTLCALLIRETSWVFPFVFILSAWLNGQSVRHIMATIWPTLMVVLCVALLFICEQHYRHLVDVSWATRPLTSQLLTQIGAYHYLLLQPTLLLTPNIDPDLTVYTHADWPLLAQGVVLAMAMLAALSRVVRQRCWLAGGVVWFFLWLLPTNSVMPRLDIANDRHLYPALIGLIWMSVLMASRWHGYQFGLLMLCVIFGLATLVRNEDYQSEVTLWLRTSEQSPNKSRAWNNLGVACQRAGDSDCARQAFSRALTLDANNMKAGNNLYFLLHKP